MAKQKAKIEKWSVIGYNTDPYKAPEQDLTVLVGLVSGHPKMPDGAYIHTSPLIMISNKNKLAETNNTVYELGEPDPEFVRWLGFNGLTVDQYEIGRMDA